MATHPLWRPYVAAANEQRQSQRVTLRQVQPGPPHTAATDWAAAYQLVRQHIEDAIPDQVQQIHHVGSTAVVGLLAKPVLNIDVNVPAPDDEAAYRPRREVLGFRLIFRDDTVASVTKPEAPGQVLRRPRGTRTHNPRIKSPLLCQLS